METSTAHQACPGSLIHFTVMVFVFGGYVVVIGLVVGKVGNTGGENGDKGKEGDGEGHNLAQVLFLLVLDECRRW